VSTEPDGIETFDSLFEAHHTEIFRYCVRRLGIEDAEDATAEVFVVAWRRQRELPTIDSRRAWLYGVAHKVVANLQRSRHRRQRLLSRLERSAVSPETEPSDLQVLEALDMLNKSDQELLRLTAWEGLSRSEIATVLGIKENAVDQRLHRARARLRQRYERIAPAAVTTQEASA
jgi:RNA polymerase sigma-70 factor (ECF subfamily)